MSTYEGTGAWFILFITFLLMTCSFSPYPPFDILPSHSSRYEIKPTVFISRVSNGFQWLFPLLETVSPSNTRFHVRSYLLNLFSYTHTY